MAVPFNKLTRLSEVLIDELELAAVTYEVDALIARARADKLKKLFPNPSLSPVQYS
jgi:hypothetical protein